MGDHATQNTGRARRPPAGQLASARAKPPSAARSSARRSRRRSKATRSRRTARAAMWPLPAGRDDRRAHNRRSPPSSAAQRSEAGMLAEQLLWIRVGLSPRFIMASKVGSYAGAVGRKPNRSRRSRFAPARPRCARYASARRNGGAGQRHLFVAQPERLRRPRFDQRQRLNRFERRAG